MKYAVPETPFKQLQIGELELTIISDGYQVMKPSHPIFAPFTAPQLVKQLLEESFRPLDYVNLSLHILLIKKKDQLIMIDSGLGRIESTSGYLQQGLIAAGFKVADITAIVLTHAHPDHIGGLTDENGDPAFPKAQIYITKTEFDFWTAQTPDFTKSALNNDRDLIAGLSRDIKTCLENIRPQLQLIEPDDLLFECLQLIAAPGHTPGHIIIRVFSGNEELIHIADLVHSEVLLFPHPEWGFVFDTHFTQAVDTRISILKMLAENKTLTLAYHLPWPGLGYVRNKDNAFEWVPKAYATPIGN